MKTKTKTNGVYILHNDQLFTVENWSKQQHPTIAEFVVLITDHVSVKIAKKSLGEMTWEEAMKHDLADSIEGHEIGLNHDKLKEALELIGGDPIEGWHWTKTEYFSNIAWTYYGNNGYLSNNLKFSSNYVRPVTSFHSLLDFTFKAPQEAIINSRGTKEKAFKISQKDLEFETLALNIAGCLYSSLIDEDKAKASILARRMIENNKELISDFIKG